MAITVINDQLVDGHLRNDARKGFKLPVERIIGALTSLGYSLMSRDEQAYNRDESQREGKGYQMLVFIKKNTLPFGLVFASDAQSSIKGFLGTSINGEFYPVVSVFSVHNRLAHVEQYNAVVAYLSDLIDVSTSRARELTVSLKNCPTNETEARTIILSMQKSIGRKLGIKAMANMQVSGNMLNNRLSLLLGLLPLVCPFQWQRYRVRYSLELVAMLNPSA